MLESLTRTGPLEVWVHKFRGIFVLAVMAGFFLACGSSSVKGQLDSMGDGGDSLQAPTDDRAGGVDSGKDRPGEDNEVSDDNHDDAMPMDCEGEDCEGQVCDEDGKVVCGTKCVDLTTSTRHCGQCWTNCGDGTCVDGQCDCRPGEAPCGREDEWVGLGGCVSEEAERCGPECVECEVEHGTPICDRGECKISQCAEGWGDCDTDFATGCEADLSLVENCGSCGIVCPKQANATPVCNQGKCELSCDANWGDCDGVVINGCETPLNTLTNCGGCSKACWIDNATATCDSGECELSQCNWGWDDCDGNPDNGCEVDLHSVENCGGCGVLCQFDNATATCATGDCKLLGCNQGWGDCDGSHGNGCETPLNTQDSCGSCGRNCLSGESCCNLRCVRVNGVDVNNCGACEKKCRPGEICDNGVCKCGSGSGCGAGQTCCLSGCEDTENDVNNCGTCGRKCPTGYSCCSGECVLKSSDVDNCGTCGNACGPDELCCSGTCVDVMTSNNNCGGCGAFCSSGRTCCKGNCVNLLTDRFNCGSCRNSCVSGSDCCSGNCTDITKNSNNCGSCGFKCDPGKSCCARTCIDLSSDTQNCGQCGRVCSHLETCVNGNCQCPSGLINCGGVCVNISSDRNHCGGCGNQCPRGYNCKDSQCVCSQAACEYYAPTKSCRYKDGTACDGKARSTGCMCRCPNDHLTYPVCEASAPCNSGGCTSGNLTCAGGTIKGWEIRPDYPYPACFEKCGECDIPTDGSKVCVGTYSGSTLNLNCYCRNLDFGNWGFNLNNGPCNNGTCSPAGVCR